MRRPSTGEPWAAAIAASGAFVALAACGPFADDGVASTAAITPGGVQANATVTYIVDGDTIDALIDTDDGEVEERIRLIGIDTPETNRPDTPIECFGPEATEYVTALVPVGTPIRLERDVVPRDDFGRLLGYVYRAEDGLFVNHEMVRSGYATPLSIEPNTTFRELMVDAARAAEADELGLWGACGG